MSGFLGTRGDFLSDLLVIALVFILPALAAAIQFAVQRRLVLHKRMMLSIFAVLVLYVVIYEANLVFLGGINYLRSNIRIPEGPYFTLVAFHIAASAISLILGGIVMRKGGEALSSGQVFFTSYHRRLAWLEVAILGISVVTGLIIYYLTFIY